MLDRWSLKVIAPSLKKIATLLQRAGLSANQITITGFVVGLSVIPLLAWHYYFAAVLVIIFNRICDGVDGELARLNGPSDEGAFLDIVLDFIFYSAVVFGMALSDPQQNALPAALLLFSFMGTGSSFLAFAIMAQRKSISSIEYPNKGFYYLGGLAEGTETIMFLLAFCLFADSFVWLAVLFSIICWLTTGTRLIGGYYSLRKLSANNQR